MTRFSNTFPSSWFIVSLHGRSPGFESWNFTPFPFHRQNSGCIAGEALLFTVAGPRRLYTELPF
jgi:hypothetical protein